MSGDAMKYVFWSLALAACATDEPREKERFAGTLDVEVTRQADVSIEMLPGGVARVKLTLKEAGHGVADADAVLAADGRVESFAEAGLTLVTAQFAGAAKGDGPCGASPISLALSLARRDGSTRFAGALTAYCGEGVTHGTPARVLRLAGALPRAK